VFRNGTQQKELWSDGVLRSTATTDIGAITLDRTTIGVLDRGGSEHRLDGVVPLAAIYNRALTPGEIVALSANPWQLFEPEPIHIYWPGVGGGTEVFLDAPVSIDWCGSHVVDARLSVDHRALLRTDVAAAIDHLAFVALAGVLAVDHAADLARDSAAVLDWLASVAQIRALPVDMRSGLVAECIVPITWTGAVLVTADAVLPTEWRAKISADGLISIEHPAQILVDSILAAECLASASASEAQRITWLASLALDCVVPAEWQGGVELTATADHSIPIEWRAIVAFDRVIPFELRTGVLADQVSAIDWLRAVTAGPALPLSTVVIARSNQVIPIEYDGTRRGFVTGNVNVFFVDERGTVWHVEARGSAFQRSR